MKSSIRITSWIAFTHLLLDVWLVEWCCGVVIRHPLLSSPTLPVARLATGIYFVCSFPPPHPGPFGEERRCGEERDVGQLVRARGANTSVQPSGLGFALISGLFCIFLKIPSWTRDFREQLSGGWGWNQPTWSFFSWFWENQVVAADPFSREAASTVISGVISGLFWRPFQPYFAGSKRPFFPTVTTEGGKQT